MVFGGSAMFKILVVEDDKDLNKTVCSFLNHSGYEAIGCLNANDAYDALTDNIIDLIVSDIMMPGIDGFEFAENVRELNEDIPGLHRRFPGGRSLPDGQGSGNASYGRTDYDAGGCQPLPEGLPGR